MCVGPQDDLFFPGSSREVQSAHPPHCSVTKSRWVGKGEPWMPQNNTEFDWSRTASFREKETQRLLSWDTWRVIRWKERDFFVFLRGREETMGGRDMEPNTVWEISNNQLIWLGCLTKAWTSQPQRLNSRSRWTAYLRFYTEDSSTGEWLDSMPS